MKNNNMYKKYQEKDIKAIEYRKKLQESNCKQTIDIDQALADKLEREFKHFCKELLKKDKKKILDSAYEITVKEEIKEELKNMDLHNAEKELMFLQDDLLTEFYHDWLNCDTPLGESLKDSLEDSIIMLTRYAGKRNMNLER